MKDGKIGGMENDTKLLIDNNILLHLFLARDVMGVYTHTHRHLGLVVFV